MPSDAHVSAPSDFPSPQFPVIFADNASSLISSPTTVKFYLARIDPSFQGDGRSQPHAIAQIVMPLEGFAMMFVFFEAQITAMVNSGDLTEEQLAQWRAVFKPGQST